MWLGTWGTDLGVSPKAADKISWDSRPEELPITKQDLFWGNMGHLTPTLQEWIPRKTKHSERRCQKQQYIYKHM